jgi:hypothetical protein
MISKEDFNKLWKDSTREQILNQYYYDYIELRKVYSIIKEAREYNEHLIRDAKYHLNEGHLKKMKKILDKVEENK